MTARPVLIPGGWPLNEREREACARVLLACKGDFERIIDTPSLQGGAFVRHIARIRFFERPDAKPLFFVTGETACVQRILKLRTEVLERTAVFDQVSWVICLETARLADFIEQAADWAPLEEVVCEGLYAWRTKPWPMLIVDWSVKAANIAAALTSVETAPESGFIATVAASHARAAFNAEGTVVGLESLTRMRAQPHARQGARPAQDRPPRQAGGAAARDPGASQPNPRIRRRDR